MRRAWIVGAVLAAVGSSLWVRAWEAPFLVKDITVSADPHTDSSPSEFLSINGLTYFVADDGIHGREIWATDGTPEGTTLYADLVPGPVSSAPLNYYDHSYGVAGQYIFFTATDPEHGSEIWAVRTSAQPSACTGDCDGDRSVTVAELVTAVNIALGALPAAACQRADANGDNSVHVDELIGAVRGALDGCR